MSAGLAADETQWRTVSFGEFSCFLEDYLPLTFDLPAEWISGGSDVLSGCLWAEAENANLFSELEDGALFGELTEEEELQFEGLAKVDGIMITFRLPGDFLSWHPKNAAFLGEEDIHGGFADFGIGLKTVSSQEEKHGQVSVLTVSGTLENGRQYDAVAVGLLNGTDSLLVEHTSPADTEPVRERWSRFLQGFAVWDEARFEAIVPSDQ